MSQDEGSAVELEEQETENYSKDTDKVEIDYSIYSTLCCLLADKNTPLLHAQLTKNLLNLSREYGDILGWGQII